LAILAVLTPYQVSCELGVTDKVARQLIRHGHLATVSAINPINRCPQTVVMPTEVERFGSEYVSRFALAKGVEPVFDVSKIGATFCRRCHF
jgi:hypothetical protein